VPIDATSFSWDRGLYPSHELNWPIVSHSEVGQGQVDVKRANRAFESWIWNENAPLCGLQLRAYSG